MNYRLGRILVDDHRHAEALACFETAIAHAPDHARSLEWRVTALRALGRFGQAEDRAREALERFPKCPWLYVELGWVFADQGNYKRAIAEATLALSIDGLNSWALRSRVDFLRRAYLLDQAETAAASALVARDDDPRIHTTAAWVSSSRGLYSDALARVGEALRIDPDNCWALSSRIDFLRQAQRFREGEEAVADALGKRPDDPDMYVAAAWMYSAKDREDEAVSHVARALAIDGRNPGALTAQLYFLRWARMYGQAEEEAVRAVEARPDDPDVLTAAGWVLSDRDKHDQALRYAERALENDPRNSWALSCRVNFLRAANRYDDAEQAAADALVKCPDDPYIHTVVGFLDGEEDA
jgi:tetratricopeptide (TPR) repeat protein